MPRERPGWIRVGHGSRPYDGTDRYRLSVRRSHTSASAAGSLVIRWKLGYLEALRKRHEPVHRET